MFTLCKTPVDSKEWNWQWTERIIIMNEKWIPFGMYETSTKIKQTAFFFQKNNFKRIPNGKMKRYPIRNGYNPYTFFTFVKFVMSFSIVFYLKVSNSATLFLVEHSTRNVFFLSFSRIRLALLNRFLFLILFEMNFHYGIIGYRVDLTRTLSASHNWAIIMILMHLLLTVDLMLSKFRMFFLNL